MRAANGVKLDMFGAEEDFRERRVPESLRSKCIRQRFVADAAVMDNMMEHQRQSEQMEKRQNTRAGKLHGKEKGGDSTMRGVLYAGVVGIVSRPPSGLQRRVTMAVTLLGTFALEVSRATTSDQRAEGIVNCNSSHAGT